MECRDDAELSLVFTDDADIAEYNGKYLNRSGPTDVIAFPMLEGPASEINSYLLGDVLISVETAIRQAEAAEHDVETEIDMLIIHGILHLLGYDHEKGEGAEKEMFEKQNDLKDSQYG